jgi:hypothetical protein
MSTPSHRSNAVKAPGGRSPFRALGRAFDHLSFVIFGQRAPGSISVGWLPGNGGYGSGGGQVPPWVPYNSDWDPKNRIR